MEFLGLMDALAEGQQRLQEKGIESARLECEMILSHILGYQRHQLYIKGNELLEPDRLLVFRSMLERRLKGEPVQYILGSREFMGLNFRVDKRVLIPRWETEVLVEYVVDKLKQKRSTLHILDLGTGSGAIAVSLAVYLPDSRITAVDVQEDALQAARENAEQNGAASRIEFLPGDMFSALDPVKHKEYFDAVVSNPPYIPSDEIQGLMPEVRDFEPRAALDGGPDGLNFYRRIAKDAHFFLKKDGLVVIEMGYGQSQPIQELFLSSGKYGRADILKDLAGIDRTAAFFRE
jgi:release factor glutamine methyltransferase